ncbi:hypothetical protein [Methyloceanibacter caenitepidi]|uniref:Uncharacterized protein n=1 Tax=Methyloceanibacter caenitepidi TaxID=1384459 RepID=A0A0A8K3Q4_9HYPH|nr:hypothetical protein [Methyloceanibacter caenitepidi]BAQ16634.1 hypothetical protein GL4_1176 [Methyloceanibacter caenitepidi]
MFDAAIFETILLTLQLAAAYKSDIPWSRHGLQSQQVRCLRD